MRKKEFTTSLSIQQNLHTTNSFFFLFLSFFSTVRANKHLPDNTVAYRNEAQNKCQSEHGHDDGVHPPATPRFDGRLTVGCNTEALYIEENHQFHDHQQRQDWTVEGCQPAGNRNSFGELSFIYAQTSSEAIVLYALQLVVTLRPFI